MLNAILIDAGPLIALFDKDDHYHEPVKAFLRGKAYRFVSTIAVFTEVSYMLNFSIRVQLDFFEWVMNQGVRIEPIFPEDMCRITGLIKKYGDRPMDFADATLVVAAEKTGIKSIISLDADFDIYRLPGKERIRNVFRQEKN
jgi:predicted nucleic acid-binding protein